MFTLLTILLITFTYGHQTKIDDADLQSEYMPQQLNPAFVSKDEPWKAIMPMKQIDTSLSNAITTYTALTIKYYSRIVACVVLALSALIEISVYLVEFKQPDNAILYNEFRTFYYAEITPYNAEPSTTL